MEFTYVAHVVEDCRHEVYLLGYAVTATCGNLARRVEDEDGRAIEAERGLIFRVVGLIGMVAREEEDRVVVPRLLACRLEETPERMVRVADAFVHYAAALFGERVAIGSGNYEGVVARGGEDRGHEGLFQLAHFEGVELKERLVPYCPRPVKIIVAVKSAVLVILRAAVIFREARVAGEGLEAHAAVGGPVEESGLIAHLVQAVGNSADVVEG